MKDINREAVLSIYDAIQKGLEGKSVRVPRKEITRLEENYSYRILDNFNIDKVDEYVLSRQGTGTISIAEMRKLNITSEYEMMDSLYPTIRKGLSHTGDRRSRQAPKEQKGLIHTELIEINTTSLVPDIIYLLTNETFIAENYYSLFTEEEVRDLNNLFISLMSRTLTNREKDKIKKYFMRDKITERFYRNMREISPTSVREYKHPNPLDVELFKNLTVVIEDEFDIIHSYVKSVMLPVTIIILSRMNRHNTLNNKYRMMVRSISGYRVVVERDIKCSFSPTYSTGAGVVFKPELTILKTIHRTKLEAMQEIEKLSSDDFQDMINSQFGGIRAIEEVEKYLHEEDLEEEALEEDLEDIDNQGIVENEEDVGKNEEFGE